MLPSRLKRPQGTFGYPMALVRSAHELNGTRNPRGLAPKCEEAVGKARPFVEPEVSSACLVSGTKCQVDPKQSVDLNMSAGQQEGTADIGWGTAFVASTY